MKSLSNINSIGQSQPAPLYQKVKNYITQRITTGDWPRDTRIPSEHKLVKTLGVSRMTVNRALRELTAEGYLIRLQGVGSFVSPGKPQSALLEIRSIADDIQQRGGKHTSQVHLLSEEKAPPDIAAQMELAAGQMIFHSIIVHSENGKPVQYSDRYVNPVVAPDYLNQDFESITPSRYLLDIVPLTEAEHIIEAVIPERQVQMLLGIKSDEPCLLLNRRTWSKELVATKSRFVYPGSRHRLGGRFKPASGAVPLIA